MTTALTLNNGVEIPAIGLGVDQTPPDVVPAVNQIELHPYFQQRELQAVHARHGILTQAWSPIGGITAYRDAPKRSFEEPIILAIGERHGRTAAQVMLRWHIQHGVQVIPTSTRAGRIAENVDVFDFELSADELARIDALDTGVRGGPEPEVITLEAFGMPIPRRDPVGRARRGPTPRRGRRLGDRARRVG